MTTVLFDRESGDAADADVPRADADRHPWVPAAPFRAHLQFVVEHSGVPWQIVALHAGMPVSLARSLLFGREDRPGRRLARLPQESAENLLRVSVESARALRRTWLDATPTAFELAYLARRGVLPDAVPADLGLPAALLTDVLTGRADFVTADVALGVRAALAWCDAAALRAAAA